MLVASDIATKPQLLYRQSEGTYDAVAFTMGTHLLSELWKIRGSRDTLSKLAQLVARRSSSRLSSNQIAGVLAQEALRRCLIGWFDDARDDYLEDSELTTIGLRERAIPESYSGAVEWLAPTERHAWVMTATSVILHCELGDMYEAIEDRQQMSH
jgi:hypothetical protein